MKTLKDIEVQKDVNGIVIATDTLKLQQEAIKWIKWFENPDLKIQHDYIDSGYGEYTDRPYGNVVNWIKHFFFNITDDSNER